ncbi:MAG: hypothetical protein A2Y38_08170 [Spirochaetes bacterium GWB1_59_5]|nr:MAG: hypothetical protein A2Y38_08170 [Spirochaetes bacterium GWB1_59_5]
MSHLLHVTRWKFEAVTRGGLPLIIEFPVHPDTAPYLVTSSQGLLWIEQPVGHADTKEAEPLVRAAVRDTTPNEIFTQVVEQVLQEGRKRQWGNVHPLTAEGLVAAREHLAFYDLGETDILAPVDEKDSARQLLKVLEQSYQPCGWLPSRMLVLVPKDRTFVGVVGRLTSKKVAGVIHNPARSIAILTAEPTKAHKRKKAVAA